MVHKTRLRLSFAEVAVSGLAALIISQFVITEYSSYAGRRDGRADAIADMEAGILKLQIGGKPQPWTPIFIRICREGYGVETERQYGCVPSPYRSSYLNAYNEVMEPHISKISGEFSVSGLIQEAHDEWSRRNALADRGL